MIVNPDEWLKFSTVEIIVEDNADEDENQEIELTRALKIEPDYEVGERIC